MGCYNMRTWTYDDMDGRCHPRIDRNGNKVGYKHVCVDNKYYRKYYKTVKCDATDDICFCEGEPREFEASKGCFSKNPDDADYPYHYYACSYGQNDPDLLQYGMSEESDTPLNTGIAWYMYMIGVIVALLVFILGIYGGYRCWMRQRKNIAKHRMSTDLLNNPTCVSE